MNSLADIHAQCDKLIESRGAFSVPIAKSLKIALTCLESLPHTEHYKEDWGKCPECALAAIQREFESTQPPHP